MLLNASQHIITIRTTPNFQCALRPCKNLGVHIVILFKNHYAAQTFDSNLCPKHHFNASQYFQNALRVHINYANTITKQKKQRLNIHNKYAIQITKTNRLQLSHDAPSPFSSTVVGHRTLTVFKEHNTSC